MNDLEYYKAIYGAIKKHPRALADLNLKIETLGGIGENDQDKYDSIRYIVYSLQHALGLKVDPKRTIGQIKAALAFRNDDRTLRGTERDGPIMVAWLYYNHPDEANVWHEQLQPFLDKKHQRFQRPNVSILWSTKEEFDAFQEQNSVVNKGENNADKSAPQPKLGPRPLGTRLLHYAYEGLSEDEIGRRRKPDFLGRGYEVKMLQKFIDADAPFLWMQIAGIAGQGKSRLAFELWNQLAPASVERSEWACGFIDGQRIRRFKYKNWRKWQPDRPHLLIADYVVGQEKELGKLLDVLLMREDLRKIDGPFHKVRLLLIERQRWDRGLVKEIKRSDNGSEGIEIQLSEGLAYWYQTMRDNMLVNSVDFEQGACRFGETPNGVLELGQLLLDDLLTLTKQAAEATNANIFKSDEDLKQQLVAIDPQRRPLYAILLGEVLAADPGSGIQKREALLHAVINNDWEKRWSRAFAGDAPIIGADTLSMRLAVIATILNGFDVSKAIRSSLLSRHFSNNRDREEALVLTNAPRSITAFGAGKIIPPILPNLLGEFFVISALQQGSISVDEIFSACWKIDAYQTANFLQRLSQDFSSTEFVRECFEFSSVFRKAKLILASRAAEIVQNFYDADVEIPPDLIEILYLASSELTDHKAMNALGICYYSGQGVERDFIASFELFQQSAEHGNSDAITNMAVCYLQGLGTVRDEEKALSHLLRAIELGNPSSMLLLGNCFRRGELVLQNSEQAFNLYSSSAQLGNSTAMVCLAGCYRQGLGTVASSEDAIHWYQRAIDLGNRIAITVMRYEEVGRLPSAAFAEIFEKIDWDFHSGGALAEPRWKWEHKLAMLDD